MNVPLVFLLLLVSVSASISAMELETVLAGVPAAAVETLKTDGEAYRLDRNHSGIMLLPDTPMAHDIRQRINSLEPDVFTEALYLIPYPQGKNSIDLEFYNLTRQVSAISEVVYMSARKNAIVPLFDNVYAINDMKKKRRIDDPLVSSIPSSDTVLMHMKETNLGRAHYQVDYLYDGENLGFFLENLTPLRAFIKVVDRENMQINMIFMPVEEGFLVYGSCGVKLSNANTVFKMMDPYSGFYKRQYAMVTWIYNTMHGTQRSPAIGKALEF